MRREQEVQPFEKPREISNELEKLYSSWGVFELLGTTIDLLPPDWLRVLNISRNLLDGKPIPGVSIPNALKALTERGVRIDYEKRLGTRKWQEPTEIPSDQIEVRPIENLTELPRVLPAHLLLADIVPDLFMLRAISGDLPVSECQKPEIVMEEKSETVEELEAVKKVGSYLHQKVYVLLDVSLSMEDSNKLIFAKAVIMAYLTKAHEEEAQIYLRAFAGKTGNRQDCISKDQFPALAQYVLSISTYTDTNIATALETTILDIKALDNLQEDKPVATEILLITDGGSRTPILPIPFNVTLHTLHIQDGTERTGDPDSYSETMTREAYEDRVKEITKNSKTFTEIDLSCLSLLPEDRDTWLLKEEVGKLEKELSSKDLGNARHVADLKNRIKKVRQMATAYKKMHSARERLKETVAKELQDQDYESFRKATNHYSRRKAEAAIESYSNNGSRTKVKKTERKAKKMESKLNPKGIKQAIKNVLSSAKSPFKMSQKLKLPHQSRLSGTLFDFRIKPDK